MRFQADQTVRIKKGVNFLGNTWEEVTRFPVGTEFTVYDDTGFTVNGLVQKAFTASDKRKFVEGQYWTLPGDAVELVGARVSSRTSSPLKAADLVAGLLPEPSPDKI